MQPRILLTTLSLALSAAAAPGAAAASPTVPAGTVCTHAGRVAPDPGLTMSPRPFGFSFSGTVGPCRMSDGTVWRGTETGRGAANGSCGTRTASAVWTISWSNGTRTVIDATFAGAVNAIATTGPILEGAFAGGAFRDLHFLSGFNPLSCASPGGVTGAAYSGVFQLTAGSERQRDKSRASARRKTLARSRGLITRGRSRR